MPSRPRGLRLLRVLGTASASCVLAAGLMAYPVLDQPEDQILLHAAQDLPETGEGSPSGAGVSLGVVGAAAMSRTATVDEVWAILERAERIVRDEKRPESPEIEQAAAEVGMLLSTYLAQEAAAASSEEAVAESTERVDDEVVPAPGPAAEPDKASKASKASKGGSSKGEGPKGDGPKGGDSKAEGSKERSGTSSVQKDSEQVDENDAGKGTEAQDAGTDRSGGTSPSDPTDQPSDPTDQPSDPTDQPSDQPSDLSDQSDQPSDPADTAHEGDEVTFDDVLVAAARLAGLLDPGAAEAMIQIVPAEGARYFAGSVAGLPADLRAVVDAYGASTVGYANGRIPTSALCPLDFAPGHMLRCDAAKQLTALNEAYEKRFGVPIPMTDSYRPYDVQVRLKQTKPYLAAVPGTSNHGWGLAVDLSSPISSGASAEYAWMRLNGPDFGWDNPSWARLNGSKPEPWHFEFFAAGPIPDRAWQSDDVATAVGSGTSGTASIGAGDHRGAGGSDGVVSKPGGKSAGSKDGGARDGQPSDGGGKGSGSGADTAGGGGDKGSSGGGGSDRPSSPSPSPTGTPTPTPSGTATPTPEPSGTPTPTPEPSGTPTPTPEPSGTPTPTPEPSGTPTPTPEPSGTPEPSQEPTPEPSGTETPKPAPKPAPKAMSEPTGNAPRSPAPDDGQAVSDCRTETTTTAETDDDCATDGDTEGDAGGGAAEKFAATTNKDRK